MAKSTGSSDITSPEQTENFYREERIANFADLAALSRYGRSRAGASVITNQEQSAMAAAALMKYAKLSGQDLHGVEPVREIVIDLIASTMHVCHQLGVTQDEPFEGLCESAKRHFEAEIYEAKNSLHK